LRKYVGGHISYFVITLFSTVITNVGFSAGHAK